MSVFNTGQHNQTFVFDMKNELNSGRDKAEKKNSSSMCIVFQ